MKEPFASLPDELRDQLQRRGMPDWTAPMLATLTHERFSSEDWIYERKLDCERCLIFRDGRGTRILSRNRKRLNDTYPELVPALENAGPDRFIADGEIVAFDGRVTSFSRLQQRIGIHDPDEARTTGIPVHLYLFDLSHLDHCPLDELPLRQRKRLLREAFDFGGHLHYTPHRNTEGEAYYEEGALRYAGKVGTGFDEETLEALHARMQEIERNDSAFDDEIRESRAHWLEPELVGEFGFTEWTDDGKLRHPRYIGLREDKPAREVRRERPKHV